LKNLQYPAFAVDASNVVVGWNSDLEHLLAISRRTALGNKLALVIEARDPFGNHWCADNCGIHAMVRRGDPIHGFTLEVKDASGSRLRLFALVEALRGRGEDDYHVLFTLRPDRRQRDTPHNGTNHQANSHGTADAADRDTRAVDLTHRQTQVLRLLARGQSTHEIAAELRISLNTVRNHIQNSLSKLGAHSQAHAIAVAIRRSLI
jgi:DNA-binding CsgD family transcriptional regulator